VDSLRVINSTFRTPDLEEIQDKLVQLPPPWNPETQKKLVVFDMDETLMHCVDDIEQQETDIILEIDFPDEGLVYAGVNIRPYALDCLKEASKNF